MQRRRGCAREVEMATVKNYDLPDDLYHHKEHMWVRPDGDVAVVGLNDFAQKLAGEIQFVELPDVDDEVSADEVVGTIETGKWVGKLYAPVSGDVAEVNEDVDDDPSLINSDPYGDGWLFKIRMSDRTELENLMRGQDAVAWLEAEIAKHDTAD
jgi:glycine cleavage system H protein